MVSNKFNFTGSMVALVTPMDAQGNVDRVSLRKLVDYHVKANSAAIVSVGTTGESATLSHEEHVDVVLMTLDMADGRIPVIAGTGQMLHQKPFGLLSNLKIKVLRVV